MSSKTRVPISRSAKVRAPARCGEKSMFGADLIGSSCGTGSTGKTSVATRMRPEAAAAVSAGKSAAAARDMRRSIAPGCISPSARASIIPVLLVVIVAMTKTKRLPAISASNSTGSTPRRFRWPGGSQGS